MKLSLIDFKVGERMVLSLNIASFAIKIIAIIIEYFLRVARAIPPLVATRQHHPCGNPGSFKFEVSSVRSLC